MAKTQYLDMTGLQELVAQIKAADAATLNAAKQYVGTLPSGQTDAISYLLGQISDSEFSGNAVDVAIADTANNFTSADVEGALAELAAAIAAIDYSGKADKVDSATAGNFAGLDVNGNLTDSGKKAADFEVAGAAAAVQGATTTTVKGVEDLIGTLPTGEDAPTTVIDYINAEVAKATGDASTVASDLAAEITRAQAAEKANADAITAHKNLVDTAVSTLVGDDASKSVRAIAAEELAAKLIPESAAESLDTLEEIAAWIQAHPGDAATMNAAIQALQTQVGKKAAEGQAATGIEAEIAALKLAVGDGGSVSDAITSAIENLDATVSTVTEDTPAPEVAITITETDGKLTGVTASIKANTYEAYGAAAAVQGVTTETVASVNTKVTTLEGLVGDGIEGIPTADITKLFTAGE